MVKNKTALQFNYTLVIHWLSCTRKKLISRWDSKRELFHDDIVHILRNFNRLSRVHERYRQTTDGRRHIANAKFTFAKNESD